MPSATGMSGDPRAAQSGPQCDKANVQHLGKIDRCRGNRLSHVMVMLLSILDIHEASHTWRK